MARASDQQFDFPRTFTELFASTGRVDASFASKLYATLHPDAPVIDSIVMEYPGPVHHRPETLGL